MNILYIDCMTWKLFIDDERSLEYVTSCFDTWKVARSSEEAIRLVEEYGPPTFISFDHDLGGEDTSMVFLKWLANTHFDSVPGFSLHSSNPVGRLNIESYMRSWKKVAEEHSDA